MNGGNGAMKKKLLYICMEYCVMHRFMYKHALGIQKKIDLQRQCFEKAGYEVQYAVMSRLPQNIFCKLTDINPFSTSFDWKKIDVSQPINIVYIRFNAYIMEFGFLHFLHKIKKANKSVKVLLEFQTYPFNREYSYKDKEAAYYKLKLFIRLLRFFVDRIVICTPEYKRLYGIKTLYMPNGVEYKNGKIIPLNHNEKEIHLISVSSMTKGHGYDRIIKGMGYYYKQFHDRKVILHLVGEGSEINNYMELAKKCSVTEYVLFEGHCIGDKLNELYLLADIGVDCFGMHRQDKNMISSSLKLNEEASYGLPIIGAGKTTLDHKDCMKYLLKFPEDETDIDINNIVKFYDAVYCEDKIVIRNRIKETFRPYYDINENLKEVLEYMEN